MRYPPLILVAALLSGCDLHEKLDTLLWREPEKVFVPVESPPKPTAERLREQGRRDAVRWEVSGKESPRKTFGANRPVSDLELKKFAEDQASGLYEVLRELERRGYTATLKQGGDRFSTGSLDVLSEWTLSVTKVTEL